MCPFQYPISDATWARGGGVGGGAEGGGDFFGCNQCPGPSWGWWGIILLYGVYQRRVFWEELLLEDLCLVGWVVN